MFQSNTFVGNLGGDPEMRYTPSGAAVTNFSIASNRTYKNSDGEKITETTWVRVSAWGRLAEVCNEYLAKGKKVLVTGNLIVDPATGGPRVWQKNDGSHGASFELRADQVVFLSPSGNGEGYAAADTTEDTPF